MESSVQGIEAEDENCEVSFQENDITIEDIDEVIQRDCKQECMQVDSEANKVQPERTRAESSVPSCSNMTGRIQTNAAIRIAIQPASKSLRFRYECEGRSAGSLPGANSTPENKTFPTIQIVNHRGPAVVVVSCVTKDPPFRPHPHKLVGKDGCKKGVCTVQLSAENMTTSFSNLGIQCVKKKEVEESLKERERLRVDPFRTGFEHSHQSGNIDLNVTRLCFQAFIEGRERGKYTVPLEPVVSEPVYDKKAMADLVICKLSSCSGTVKGGTEIILLCEKVVKDDIEIKFYEEQNGLLIWENLAEFQPNDVHKQVAITFRTPPYKDVNIEQPVDVKIQLRRKSDSTTSEPRIFQYIPLAIDPEWIERKRRKVSSSSLQRYLDQNICLNTMTKTQHPAFEMQQIPQASGIPAFQQRVIKPAYRRNVKVEQTMTSANASYTYSPETPISIAQAMLLSSSQMPVMENLSIPAPLVPVASPKLYDALKTSQNPNFGERMNVSPEPNLLLLESRPTTSLLLDKSKHPANPDEEFQNSMQDFSIDSGELFNYLMPMSDSSMQAMIENTSLHLSSLESALQDGPENVQQGQNRF